MKRDSKTRMLCVLSVVFSLPGLLDAGGVDHFAFSSITSPQRVGAPFAVTVSALDTNGVVATNFSGPVQLFFSDQATPVFFNDFSGGFLFDTDGDGTSDGASLRSVSSSVTSSSYSLTLASNTTYSLSMDYAVDPGGASGVLFAPDAILYFGLNPVQIGSWGIWPPANQISRFSAYTEFNSMGEGTHTLMLRYWVPVGGSAWVYTDNVKVRVRDVSPGLVIFQQGQWSGNLTPFRTGTSLVLRALNNNGRTGDSAPFDVLPRVADVSVTMLPHDFLPTGQWAWISFLVSNAGPSSIEGVVITNELPADIALIQTVPYGGTKVASNRVVTGLSALAGQSAMTFSLIVQRDQAGDASVTATLSAPEYDTNPSNHTASGNVTFVPVLTGADVTVTETPGGTNATFNFQLTVPGTQDLVMDYSVLPISATPGTDFTPPAPGTLVFPMGSTQQSLVIPVLDDVFYESPEQFSVSLSVTNLTPVLLTATNFIGTILDNDPLPTLTVVLPSSALETSGTLSNAGALTISAPFEQDIGITVTSSDQTEILSPGTLILPAGETNTTFNIPVVDDLIFDGTQNVTITAQCTNGMSGSAQMAILDNELPNLTVTASFKPTEGNGTVTNGLRVASPIALTTNLIITLNSSDTTEMLVPASVTLLAGATFTNISPTVVDDTETDGPQPVTISASAPGFTSGSITLTVSDNDVHHFSIGAGQNGFITSKTSTVPFFISVVARDIASNTINSFTQAVTLTATGDLGFVALTPTNTGAFQGGQERGGSWFGSVVITNGANLNVRIVATDAAGHTGLSNPFTVYASPAQTTRIVGIQVVGNDLQIQFTTVAGRHYRLETAGALVGDTWSVAVPDITGTGDTMTATNIDGFASVKRFYRIALQAGP